MHNRAIRINFVDCISQDMSLDIAKLLVGFLYLC